MESHKNNIIDSTSISPITYTLKWFWSDGPSFWAKIWFIIVLTIILTLYAWSYILTIVLQPILLFILVVVQFGISINRHPKV